MGYNQIEIGLRKLLSQVEAWRQQQQITSIDKAVAMSRLQEVYASVMELETIDPTKCDYQTAATPATQATHTIQNSDHKETETNQTSNTENIEDHEEEVPYASDEQEDDNTDTNESTDSDTTKTEEENTQEIEDQKLEVTDGNENIDHDGDSKEEEEEEEEEESGDEDDKEVEADENDKDENDKDEAGDEKKDTNAQKQEHDHPATAPVKSMVTIFGIEVNSYTRHEIIDTLFRGNGDVFEAECRKIEAMDALEQAIIYIGERYRWIPDNITTIRFIDLLETYFGQRQR